MQKMPYSSIRWKHLLKSRIQVPVALLVGVSHVKLSAEWNKGRLSVAVNILVLLRPNYKSCSVTQVFAWVWLSLHKGILEFLLRYEVSKSLETLIEGQATTKNEDQQALACVWPILNIPPIITNLRRRSGKINS